MEERKEFKNPEVISYDREELAFETALLADNGSDFQKPTPTPAP
jgi:hypothetical protein